MWKISFFPANGDEISLNPVTVESPSRETAAKAAALLHFAGLTVVVQGEDESYANFSTSRYRPLSEFIGECQHWWERE
jgi:hypothetical protein